VSPMRTAGLRARIGQSRPRTHTSPRSLVLAALLVAAAGSTVAVRPSRSDAEGAVDAAGATWTISGRGGASTWRT
jgi:hypothetical protein